jgi:O-antigen/teichoic acid export membrane protein
MKSIFYKIGFNTAVQVLGKGISVILGFITVGLLTRYLGQEGFGNFTLVFAYLSLFGIIADFGLQLTMVRELAKKITPQSIYGTYFGLKIFLVIFSTFLALIFLLAFPYSQFLKIGIIIASLGVAVGVLNTYGTVVFQANLRLDLVTAVDVLTKIVTTAFIVLFVFLKSSFYNILLTILIGNLAGTVLIIFLIRKFITFNLAFDLNLAKKLIIQSFPVGLISVLALFYFKIDTLILSIFRGTVEVGIYGLAYKIIENLLVLWGFYMATVYPLLAGLLVKEKEKAWKLWRQSLLAALGLSGIIIIGGFIFAPLVIQILGGVEFKESTIALRILLFSVPLFFVNNLFYHTFLAIEETRLPLFAITSSLIFNIVLNLTFIPKWGYIAASVNTLITEGFLLGFYYLCYRSVKLRKI